MHQPLKWHGGKFYVAKRIIELMCDHTHYVEPFYGGGAVLLNKDPSGVSEVVNDIDGALTNFWRVLQDPNQFGEFSRRIEAMPFSEAEWNDTEEFGSDPVMSAVRFFVRVRQSRAGQMRDFATLSRNRIRRQMNEGASAWLTAVEGLPAVHDRLKRVVILNRDAIDVIRTQDGENTLFYLDPPYLHSTRTSTDIYQHEMSDAQHERLLRLLTSIRGMFLLSGYRNELYEEYANANGWDRVEFDLPNNAAGGKSKRRMVECIWGNYPLPKLTRSVKSSSAPPGC